MSDCCKKTYRTEKAKKQLINRLSRIEGQVRGLCKMVENDSYCADILIQAAAVSGAVCNFEKLVLENHIKTCVADDIKNGNGDTIEELTKLLSKLMK